MQEIMKQYGHIMLAVAAAVAFFAVIADLVAGPVTEMVLYQMDCFLVS